MRVVCRADAQRPFTTLASFLGCLGGCPAAVHRSTIRGRLRSTAISAFSLARRFSEPADNVFFVEGPASNWVILKDGDRFTLIDGGYPADTPLVLDSIRMAGLDPANAAAMLITHGHVDHTGAAQHFVTEYGTPILSSAAENGQMRGTERFQVAPIEIIRRAWRPRIFKWMLHVLQSGGTKGTEVPTAAVWTEEQLAVLPGSPVAVPTPGHTPGHTVYLLPSQEIAITGDALITGHAINRGAGPQMLHPMFHHDSDEAYRALSVIKELNATLILPGHGPALAESVVSATAIAAAR